MAANARVPKYLMERYRSINRKGMITHLCRPFKEHSNRFCNTSKIFLTYILVRYSLLNSNELKNKNGKFALNYSSFAEIL